jgi:DNA-binding response OmpR family regulator
MKEKILIVEDDKFLGEFLLKRLKEEGFEVFLATNGEEGFNLAREKRPELIILDLILPEKNGYEVLEDLKKNPLTSNIPVLVLSNLGQKEEVEEAFRKGAEDFLIKAYYSLDDIALRVRLHLKKSKK